MVHYISRVHFERFNMNVFFNRYKFFVFAIGILLIICLAGSVVLTAISCSDNEKNSGSLQAENKNPVDAVLKESADAGQEYIDKIYFIGDSTTLHFHKGGIDRTHILVPESGTLMLSSDILTLGVMADGVEMTIPEAVKNTKPEILILTLGVNGANNFSETAYKTYYKKLINGIEEASPDTKIILQSVFPVTADYEAKAITNEGIDRLNGWVLEIAQECSLSYLDTQSVLKDASGAQKAEFSEGDGVHMNAAAYKKIVEYIRTHALK